MTWIKICGITNLEDALTAADAGADALGFVFYEKSPRNVSPDAVRGIVRQLPEQVEKVGVFVGKRTGDILDLIWNAGLTGMQNHLGPHCSSVSDNKAYGMGCFPPGFKSYLSLPAEWFIKDEEGARKFISDLARAAEFTKSRVEATSPGDFFQTIFLDSSSLQQPGGTGKVFDWQKAAPVVDYMRPSVKVVVAGGLTPSNVTEAIRILKPWGVDVSSGVEASPGKKDPEKVRAFIAAVRAADERI